MSKKALILTSVASMIQQFNMDNINILLGLGYEVEVACNFKKGNTCDQEAINNLIENLDDLKVKYYQVDFNRNIFKINDLFKSLKKVIDIMKVNKYTFIHCHSPIGGVCGRLAGHLTKTKVIYTAHGFHFYKGAPLKNWIMFYSIEKLLSRWTDLLITINKEDYEMSKKFHAKRNVYVPGIGVEVNHEDKKEKNIRNEFTIQDNEFFLLSVGELNKNKNHEVVIKALSNLKEYNFKYIICGIGNNEDYLKNLANELGIGNKIYFSGYRKDIKSFYQQADIFIFPSFREGLSVALMEAMSFGLPIICSNIRGNKDLVINNRGGYLFDPTNQKELVNNIEKLFLDSTLREKFGNFNRNEINKFSKDTVSEYMERVYFSVGVDVNERS